MVLGQWEPPGSNSLYGASHPPQDTPRAEAEGALVLNPEPTFAKRLSLPCPALILPQQVIPGALPQ